MFAESFLVDLELFLVGLIMAGTVCCDGPQFEDPTDNFGLWRESWDTTVSAWNFGTRERGWLAVGMHWEYHEGDASAQRRRDWAKQRCSANAEPCSGGSGQARARGDISPDDRQRVGANISSTLVPAISNFVQRRHIS